MNIRTFTYKRCRRGDRKGIYRLASAVLITVMLVLMTRTAAYAQSIDLNRTDGSITLYLHYTDPATQTTHQLNDGAVTVYRVADIRYDNGNYSFDATAGQFKDVSGLKTDTATLTDLTSNARLAETLAGNTTGKEGTTAAISNGSVTVKDLRPGLYLMVQTTMSSGNAGFNPFLFSIPMDGKYQIDGTAKPTVLGTTSGEVETEKKENQTEQPGTEKPPKKETEKTPSGGGSTPSGGSTPTPSGGGGSNSRLPQTGQLWWPVPLLAAAGLLLLLFGIVKRKKDI